jgi:hypothetical protein
MELVEKIMELNYHSIHADQWRRITVQRRESPNPTPQNGRMELCVDGVVDSTYYDNYWFCDEGLDVITGERWSDEILEDYLYMCDEPFWPQRQVGSW